MWEGAALTSYLAGVTRNDEGDDGKRLVENIQK